MHDEETKMPQVVAVRFRPATKSYYFDPGSLTDLKGGDKVIVETARAQELGQVVGSIKEVPQDQVVGQLKPVLRRATEEDLASARQYSEQEMPAVLKCRERVAKANLPIKVVQAEYSFDGSHLAFFFTSEQRVDFRDLVRDLAHAFHARIELRQIGVRDEAKLIRGIGPCGRELCCATHLCEFVPVSIKMAKLQNLPLSPMEISGTCGRLLCCLTYENAYYQEVVPKMPKYGDIVTTAKGVGRVVGGNAIKESVNVEMESGIIIEVPLVDIQERQPAPKRLPETQGTGGRRGPRR
jgi:cell fate regulator YaaT (PSP1 superfamily)